MTIPRIHPEMFAFALLVAAIPLAAQTAGTTPTAVTAPADTSAPTPSAKSTTTSPTEVQLLDTWLPVQRSSGGLGKYWTFLPGGKLELSTGVVVETWYKVEGDRLITPPTTTKPDAKSEIHVFRVEGDTLFQRTRNENMPEAQLAALRAKMMSAGVTEQQIDTWLKSERPMNRVGTTRAGDPPIVGIWKMPDTADATVAANLKDGLAKAEKPVSAQTAQVMATQLLVGMGRNMSKEFTRDGLLIVLAPMATTSGNYNLAAQTLTYAAVGSPASSTPSTAHFGIEAGLLVITAEDGKTKETFIRSNATKEELKRAGVTPVGKAPSLDPP